MSFLKGIFESLKVNVSEIVDEAVSSNEEKMALKNQLISIITTLQGVVIEAQKEVLKTEMSGNFLQRSWRPILMLVFGGLLVMRWLGLTTTIPQEVELELMSIIKIALGGYVVGRTVEKTADKVVSNVDIPFIRKKDRGKGPGYNFNNYGK